MATPPGPRIAPQNDLYTAMLMIAAGLLLFGIIFISVRSMNLFGSVLPPAGG